MSNEKFDPDELEQLLRDVDQAVDSDKDPADRPDDPPLAAGLLGERFAGIPSPRRGAGR